MSCEQEKAAFDAAQSALDQSVVGRAAAQQQRDQAADALVTAEQQLGDAKAAVESAASDANQAYDAYIACVLGESNASPESMAAIRTAYKVAVQSLCK